MMLRDITPMLRAKDIKATVEYYTKFLQFTCESYDEKRGWASIKRDNVNIMFSKPNAHIPFEKPIFTGSLYIYTDNVDAIWENIKESANICYPIETFDYGMREFGIYDNNGYLLQFGQEIT